MSGKNYFEMCRSGIGRPVRITTRDGRVHTGMIGRVTNSRVYLQPYGPSSRGNYGGFGYGGFAYPYGRGRYGYRYGFGGFGAGIALGAITALAFLPFLFW